MRGTLLRSCLAVWAVLLFARSGWGAGAPVVPDEHARFFESKVRPLLIENCQPCHGEKKQKGGLRLDSAAAIQKGGKNGPVITPGQPTISKLITAINYTDKGAQMPPEDKGQLTKEQIAVL